MGIMAWGPGRRLASVLAAGIVGLGGAGCAPGGAGEWRIEPMVSTLEVAVAPPEVRLALYVTNTTDTVQELTFPTSQRYDFMVTDCDGREIWRWSADRAFLQVVTQARLEPQETWTMSVVWPADSGSGCRAAVAWLTATDAVVEQRTEFELP
jgi:hypothetical protein